MGCPVDDAEERHHRSGGVHDLAMVACGAALVFGGEIHEFVRRIIMLVLVVSFIVGVTNLASALGIAGAVV
jgi:type IV secretion system protein TrbC